MIRIYNRPNLSKITNLKNADVAYLLGIIATDGCIKEHNSRQPECLEIIISEKDKEILTYIKNILEVNNKIHIYTRTGNNFSDGLPRKYAHLRIVSSELVKTFAKWCITPKKTFTLKYPVHMQKKLRRHFIRGIFDGDGSISFHRYVNNTYKMQVKLASASKDFINDLKTDLNLFGISCQLYCENRIKSNRQTLYIIRIDPKSFLSFYQLLYNYSNYYLKRKQKKFNSLIKHRSKYVDGYSLNVGKREVSRKLKKRFTKEYFYKKLILHKHKPENLAQMYKITKRTVLIYMKKVGFKINDYKVIQ